MKREAGLPMDHIEEIVKTYRNRIIEGKLIDLSPIMEEDLSDIVRMRNDPKMIYYFNQKTEITLDSQKEWYQKYMKRTDDLYWTIKDKTGKVIGTNRLYNIMIDKCEQGSLMIDTQHSKTAPYAVEGIMLSVDFAFDILGVCTIVNENRCDNKNMNSLSRRFGYKFLHEIDIRGVVYNYCELQREHYKRDDIEEIINLWMER